MRGVAGLTAAGAALIAIASTASAEGDPRRGGEVYRTCVACHSLEPGLHLTGPSLAGLLARTAGAAPGFDRYSEPLTEAEFEWDTGTLDAFLSDPETMFPGTYMTFPGIEDAEARADLVAFLAVATAPGGAESVVDQGLISAEIARGQAPPPLGDPPLHGQVTGIRHCGESFFITTADGVETPFWEKNVRLKIDSAETGPPSGVPVILGAGMRGDRVSVIFSEAEEIDALIEEKC